jgi:hypothetical protein
LPAEVSDDPNPEPFLGVFLLNLPQSLIHSDGTPVNRQLKFGEGNLNSPTKKKIDVSDLPLLLDDGKADTSKIGDKVGTDKLEDYSAAVLALLHDGQVFHLWKRSSSTESVGLNIPPTLARALGGSTSRASGHRTSRDRTYIGDFDFLESQERFDATFPKPVKLSGDANAATFAEFEKFVVQKQFLVLQSLMLYDYVGSNACTDQRSTKALVDRIRGVKLAVTSSVDGVFHEILGLAHLLPDSVDLWHCSLPEVFLQALPTSLRDAIEGDNTLAESLSVSKLPSKGAQLRALRATRAVAVSKFNDMEPFKKLC